MGGIFGAPKAPEPAPLPPEPEPDSEEDERKARLKAIERRRRGRAGMIETSPRGVLSLSANEDDRKTLLGE